MDLDCRLCGSSATSLQLRYTVNGCAITDCPSCGFVQVAGTEEEHDPESIYVPSYFDKGKYISDPAGAREQLRRLHWMQRCGVPAGARVLDAGCATGEFVTCAKAAYEVWGVDISEHAIERARLDNPELGDRLLAGSLEQLSLEPHSFDALVLWDVVEHLWHPRRTLSKLAELLKPGGRLLLSTANIGAATARIMGKRWAFMTPPEHCAFFDRRTITRLLAGLGCQVEAWTSRGKWVNAGFFLYKLRRTFPELIPARLVDLCQQSFIGRRALYIPTGDIQYLGARLISESVTGG